MEPSHPSLLQTPHTALPPCPICGGTGVIDDGKGVVSTCRCRLQKKLLDYLTPSYADALWIKPEQGFDTSRLVGRNVLLQNSGTWQDAAYNRLYRTAVKSFLLNNKARLRFHTCLGAKEVADAAYSDEMADSGMYERIQNVELLILYLAGDPPNRHYPQLLTTLLKHRVLQRRPTWVVTSYSLIPRDDGQLTEYYGRPFVEYIKPRQQRDPEGVGAGHFLLLDWNPIIHAMSAKVAA